MDQRGPSRIEPPVVVVTGGTKGIGRAIAERMAVEGWQVVITGRDTDAGADVELTTAEKIVGAESPVDAGTPGGCTYLEADNGDASDIARVVESTVKRYGRLDALVNNAATMRRETLRTTSADFLRSVLNINLVGAVEFTRLAVEQMITQGGGSIINIGSTHAWSGLIDLFPYSISKGGLLTLTHHVARNYASHGVRANWVTVGWVLTPGEQQVWEREGKAPDWITEKGREVVPLGRLQKPEEIAGAVAYLLSDEASQITDTELDVTGGLRV